MFFFSFSTLELDSVLLNKRSNHRRDDVAPGVDFMKQLRSELTDKT
jgi:hypothetical protein